MMYKCENNYKLYLGDVLEELRKIKDNSIDCIITSPPYNVDLSKSKGDFKLQYDKWEDNMSWEDYCSWQLEILNECYRVLKDDGYMFYNHKDKFKDGEYHNPITILFSSKFNIRQNIIWYRKNCFNFTTGGFGDEYENIYLLYKNKEPKISTEHSILGDVWRINIEKDNDHPAPFPLEIPLRCLYSIYDNQEGKTILDIFNGSGTTGVASIILNHNYIGIDISENYLDMSIKRFENYTKELKKAQEEIDLHHTKKPYNSKKVDGQISMFDII